ncbi:hypothetical protein HBH56_142800 [Parastagonospora nodorum]|uniref:Uncharacterized protein n=1 Tax=Phaeosphaeria nodorum (strain SN15 / ATCC MYA-4574 / FGSC 10173) TaxID=321614 RepID=A0A7U2FC48_PHANO|nr:hypothetical protein HBH56_142800 [Parastagonospora nodorum]QRD01539.1 hypothetical protein JI435_416940 [Parastagonospora nodorum SN15]KAH3927661.1 hypothetical protein HBH54_147990 [Parastagonospora nodorum]KAH3947931.1 hypothetical protein HBH53_108030 [Parastagonospora nodorum]KAH4065201.1 hypothetical protein HBH50_163290 [Parastagonospora nodorum]
MFEASTQVEFARLPRIGSAIPRISLLFSRRKLGIPRLMQKILKTLFKAWLRIMDKWLVPREWFTYTVLQLDLAV